MVIVNPYEIKQTKDTKINQKLVNEGRHSTSYKLDGVYADLRSIEQYTVSKEGLYSGGNCENVSQENQSNLV